MACAPAPTAFDVAPQDNRDNRDNQRDSCGPPRYPRAPVPPRPLYPSSSGSWPGDMGGYRARCSRCAASQIASYSQSCTNSSIA